ncbi:MAG: 5'/3'-nucleotidase SurE [Candidatus Helarchaeota archaeon]|nr:5'/3'-nucleotidase SurE [Candidatus Helarchaeota archaeon]
MSKKRTYRILLTNDDGISSCGLDILYHEMKKVGSVFVVAPDSEQSAISHAITVKEEICVEKYFKNGEFFGYAVGGTPADCVKLGVMEIMPKTPDIVISGINNGENTGLNIIYSGTVSAAIEATILGIPSIAISLGNWRKVGFNFAAKFGKKLAEKVLEFGLPEGTFLNVNIPPVAKTNIKGVRITRQGNEKFSEYFIKKIDSVNRIYYKLDGKRRRVNKKLETEESAIHRMEISITPIHYDLTNYKMIEKLKKWDISF